MRPIDADTLLKFIKDLRAEAYDMKYQKGLQDVINYYFPMIINDQPTIIIDTNEEGKNNE